MAQKSPSTEARIFAAASKVFLQKGMSGARMQDIADEAGINKALLHYYYRSKQKLFEVVFHEAVKRLLVSIQDLVTQKAPLEEKITAICERYITELAHSPYLPLFVLHEINQDPGYILDFLQEKQLAGSLESFFLQVQEAVAAGRIRPIAPSHLLINMIALCVFPFVARPLLTPVLKLSPQELQQFIEQRKKEVPAFVLAALAPTRPQI